MYNEQIFAIWIGDGMGERQRSQEVDANRSNLRPCPAHRIAFLLALVWCRVNYFIVHVALNHRTIQRPHPFQHLPGTWTIQTEITSNDQRIDGRLLAQVLQHRLQCEQIAMNVCYNSYT